MDPIGKCWNWVAEKEILVNLSAIAVFFWQIKVCGNLFTIISFFEDDQCNSITDGCGNCSNLQKEIERMKGEVKSLKLKATLLKNKMAKNQEKWVITFQEMQHVEDTVTTPAHIGRVRIHMCNIQMSGNF